MKVKAQKPAGRAPGASVRTNGSAAAPVAPAAVRWWLWAAAFGAALVAALLAYGPALQGEFLFDDEHMQFAQPHPEAVPLSAWVAGSRPLINLSYWLNYQLGGVSPLGYHLTNIVLHTIAALLVFLIVRKILELAALPVRRAMIVAGFCAAIFLLHPVQTESVAYISGRSESLSVALAFGAWACFLYRPSRAEGEGIGLGTVLAILLLFGASVTAKEHVAVLPLVILLTDYYWNPGFSFEGIRRNWRLYGTFVVLGVLLAAFLYSYLAHEPTVGFNLKEFTWYQYLFTQCRVLFLYLRLFLLPFGQSADYAIETSRTLFDHGAIFGMLALLAAAGAAIVWRKRFPIASYGFFVALIFFLPTSSIMPIRDLANDRRMYLPMIGLLLIAAEMLVRVRADEKRLTGVLAVIVLAASAITWNRSQVWSSQAALWSDTAGKSPEKARPHLGLASAYFAAHRYADAAREYELAHNLGIKSDGLFYSSWAAALEGAGRLKEAIQTGRKAIASNPKAPVYAEQAKLVAMDGDIQQALDLLDRAEKDDAAYEPAYIERGVILMTIGRHDEACAAFEKARTLDPKDLSAAKGLVSLGCGQAR